MATARFVWHKGARPVWYLNMMFWIVNRLPSELIYFAALRMFVHATTGKYGAQVVPDLLAMDALKRWEN